MLNGIVKLVDTALSMKERSEELIFCLIPAAFYLTFAGILLFLPQAHVRVHSSRTPSPRLTVPSAKWRRRFLREASFG